MENYTLAIDTIWVLICTCLVFFMQAGFCMVETGFTRAKNAGNIIMKNLMDFALGSVIFWIIGFSLMFGDDIGGFIGLPHFFTNGMTAEGVGVSLDFNTFLMWQTVFCATAATIVSGAMAERTKFSSYLIYSVLISAFVYPIAGHWIWGGGWLANLGFHDYAGSTVVHSIGGWSALIGAKILGPRIGKYSTNGKVNAIPGHSLTLGALGVFILWIGWFGFNPGSSLSGMTTDTNALVFMTTNIAAATSTIVTMAITWIRYGKPDVSMTLNGSLAGLVAITAGCDVVSIPGSFVIGLLAGFTIVFVVELVDKKLKIDDPVGAVGVHCACGVVGTICVGLFDTTSGLFYGGGFGLLGVQILGIACVAIWTIVCMLIIFNVLKSTIGLRVTAEEEIGGLDIHEHGLASSYADFKINA